MIAATGKESQPTEIYTNVPLNRFRNTDANQWKNLREKKKKWELKIVVDNWQLRLI